MSTRKNVTKEDLNKAVTQLMDFIKKSLADSKPVNSKNEYDTRKYLRTRDVLEILAVSRNKLKEMRLKKEIPFTKIGGTFFYPAEEFHKALSTLK